MPTLQEMIPRPSKSRANEGTRSSLTGTILSVVSVAVACGMASAAAAQPTISAAEIEALYEARLEDARARFTESDVRFMTGMLTHHTQGRDKLELAVNRGVAPDVRLIATRILSNYEDEIIIIRQWLNDRGQPLPAAQASSILIADGPDYISHSPGMLTPRQMEDLEQATGAEFDRLFLNLSIQHHLAAQMLVRSLFASAGAGRDETVSRIAASVLGEQASYIARMDRLLPEPTEEWKPR